MAEALGRPVDWFVTESPPSVISRRADGSAATHDLDRHIDAFARDVELLIELKALRPAEFVVERVPATFAEAEALASRLRAALDAPAGPIFNLAAAVQRFGLYVASVDLGTNRPDGAYVLVAGAGATIINGSQNAGRRRFTLAHELGHHAVADEYSTDWSVGESRENREKLINAFAIHFLMPRGSVTSDWARYGGASEPRDGAMRVTIDYRVSWTAACTQLQTLGLIDRAAAAHLRTAAPTKADLLERGLFVVEELSPPAVSPAFAQAVLRAYRGSKITASRAAELMRGTLAADELPPVGPVPRDALRSDLAESA